MIELTLIEIVLIAWAGLATAAWLNAREDARMSKKVLRLFIEDKTVREQILKAHAEWAQENNA